MKQVLFEVTRILDIRKTNSNIEVGAQLIGDYYKSNGAVYYTDSANVDWVFYVNSSCKIIKYIKS